MRSATRIAWVLLLSVATVYGQGRTAQLTGRITDSTGAVVPGAQMTITNVDTGVARIAQSDGSGNYAFPLLEPGKYSVSVQQTGFRPITRAGITLHVNDSVQIDFALEVGALSESITVDSAAPLLQTAEASQSVVVDNLKIMNLPLNGRNAYQLSALTPGVIPGSGFEDSTTVNRMNNINVNGGASFNTEILLDGASNSIPGHGQFALTPSVDTVQEFRVQTTQYSAEFGRTSGGVVNVATKSGTNEYHGTAYHFLRNKVLKANSFANNWSGQERGQFVYNQFGATLGGPVIRNKTFVFGGYEGYRVREAGGGGGTVPTEAMRRGDFSQLSTSDGLPVVIYDPYTSRQVGNAWVRNPFPGNQISSSRFDPVAVKVTPNYPLPNRAGIGASISGNFTSNASSANDLNMITGRLDHNFSTANRFFLRASRNNSTNVPPNILGTIATSNSFGPSFGRDWHVTANDTHTLTPSTVLEIRLGYALNWEDRHPESLGLDLTTIGLPAALNAQAQAHYYPNFAVGGYMTVGPNTFSYWGQGSQTRSLVASLTHMRGKHLLKTGVEVRILNHNSRQVVAAAGQFASNGNMTRGPDPDRVYRNAGDGYASFLLGTLASGSARKTADTSYRNIYYAGYLQDDIKVTPALTLNLGVRYSYETPRTERWNRLTWFNPAVANPIQKDITWTGAPLVGGLEFAGVNGPRGWSDPDWNNVEPRFGFAYKAFGKLVLRGGYGLSYLGNSTSHNGYGAGQEGFSVFTREVYSVDGRTPVKRLSESFSGGLLEPTGAADGLYTLLGNAVVANLRDIRAGYSQQWSLDLQREFGGWLLEAGYVGSRGVGVPISYPMNQLTEEQLKLGSTLLQSVSNPFYGHPAATGTLANRTVQRGQLLRPYPHFTGVSLQWRERGQSTFHSFQARAEKRFAKGFSLLASYTNSKLLSDTSSGKSFVGDAQPGPQNAYDMRAERSIAPQDISQRLVTSFLYDLPLGRGKRLLGSAGRVANTLFGGWQVNGIVTFSMGHVLTITTPNQSNSYNGASRPHSTGQSAKLPTSEQTIDRWFNTAVFLQPEPYTFGNLARTLPDVRADGNRNFDIGVLKHFNLTERFRLQFRSEFFNAFNSPSMGVPGTAFLGNGFGLTRGQSNSPREIQFGLKLLF
ncbi:MAG: TonB-dependent receptor [Acidobacteria bacterium]|nr:TonB-dependent receptor [Acidobacteriota bacterium]